MINRLHLCLMFVLMLNANRAGGQDQCVVDSLRSVLDHKMGADRYGPLYELAFEYIDRDNEKALEIIMQAEKAALLSGDSLWIVKSKRVKAQMLSRLERLIESVRVAEEALAIATRGEFTRERMMILNNLGCSYSYLGRDHVALSHYFETLEMAKVAKDSSAVSQALNNIGAFYFLLEDYQKALGYLLQALKMSRSIGDVRTINLNNISQCYALLGDSSNARLFLAKNRELCGTNCSEGELVRIHFAEGLIFFHEDELGKAENEWLQAYAIARKNEVVRFRFVLISVLAELYERQNRTEKLLFLLNDVEELVNSGIYNYHRELIEMYSVYYRTSYLLGDFQTAAYYAGKGIALKDSLYNEALTASLMKTEVEYRQRENRARIAAQNEVLVLKERVISHQRFLILAACLTVVSILGCLALLYKNYSKKKYLNKFLERKVKERTRQLELSRDVLLKSIKEKDLQNARMISMIGETMNTIEGLCLTGSRDLSESTAQAYIAKIRHTINCLKSSERANIYN